MFKENDFRIVIVYFAWFMSRLKVTTNICFLSCLPS